MNNKTNEGFFLRQLVVKIGTAHLCNQFGQLDQEIFDDFARQVVKLQNQGTEVIIVSSGAIKAGEERMKSLLKEKAILPASISKKELAGIGARHLMNRWGDAFKLYKKEVGQVWITYGNWTNKGEKQTFLSTIFNYLKANMSPVINEMDVVSDEEIRWMEKGISENDRLAKMVALSIGADSILFLTNEGGIYKEDPRINPRAQKYEEVSAWAKPEEIGISESASKCGTGGMFSKFIEASKCAKKGLRVAIAGREVNIILRFARGEQVGTKIGTITKLKKV